MWCLVVIEPCAKVKRKHCLNTGDENAENNSENVDGDIQSFKSEKDRPDNYAQLARGNGGEHD